MTTVALIQARLGSSRLPGKVLLDLAGHTVLGWVVRAAKAIPGVSKVIVAIPDDEANRPVADWCKANGVACYRGSENDVLRRLTDAANEHRATRVLRLTADCPLLDPSICGQVLRLLEGSGAAYASNCHPGRFPDGLDCEAMTIEALNGANADATAEFDREHVTPFIWRNSARFPRANLACSIPDLAGERWTLDDEGDLQFLRAVCGNLPADRPPAFTEVLAVLDRKPEVRNLNRMKQRNAAALVHRAADAQRTYGTSQALLKRAEKVIPLGSQTFSKSHIQLPHGAAPLFLTRGQGARVWDVDGNEYVDLVCGLLPVVLGYCDPDVDEAILRQAQNGISFSLATELEVELAERLIEIIPCAEMVRFGKNGSDVTSAAVRLARAVTNRERIAACGYHGWQDWYIGATTRDFGVPASVRGLTHRFPFNDAEALDKLLQEHPGQFACVILEPVGAEEPKPGYLESVREITHRHGALLIYDEIIAGFRVRLGGAQEYYGVAPDLACFGKSMGNGMPISAVVGRADLMRRFEDVFFSGTFGGEALSLAAAIAVIDKMSRENVIEGLWNRGRRLADEARRLIAKHQLQDVVKLIGVAPWTLLSFGEHAHASREAIRTLFLAEMLRHGVLLTGSHNVCHALNESDIVHVAAAYDAALGRIADELRRPGVEERLAYPVIRPIFSVRPAR